MTQEHICFLALAWIESTEDLPEIHRPDGQLVIELKQTFDAFIKMTGRYAVTN